MLDLNISATNAQPTVGPYLADTIYTKAGDEIWTHDIHVGNVTLYHWATPAYSYVALRISSFIQIPFTIIKSTRFAASGFLQKFGSYIGKNAAKR